MITNKQRKEVMDRSNGTCEGMVRVGLIWTRCWNWPIEIHHMITRARGGGALDKVGETYHLIALCNKHHAESDGEKAYEAGLLIDGYVITNTEGKPIYTGTDEYLKEIYS